jgi:Flp pilus assembly protein TadD
MPERLPISRRCHCAASADAANFHQLESLARRAHAIAPQQPAFADTLGSALIGNGKYADAAKVLCIAVQGLPQDQSVRTRYALALARSGDATGARRELQVALGAGGAFDERATAEKLLRELGT